MKKVSFGWLLAALAAGCSAMAELPETIEPSTNISDTTTTETDVASFGKVDTARNPDGNELTSTSSQNLALAPDQYCYVGNDSTIDGAIRLAVNESAQVSGDSLVSLYNDEAGAYSSYAQRFTGELIGDRAELTVFTLVEYDLQEIDETWLVTPSTLTIGDAVFVAADCDDSVVADHFIGPSNFAGDALLAELPPAERVKFTPGSNQAVLENAIVRGDRDVYLLGAQGGQRLSLDIDSLEDNAVFDVIAPSGTLLAEAVLNDSLALPQTGDYTVIVGGTRGNATYTLEVKIE